MMKLHARTGEERYRDAARRLADFLIYVQRLNGVGSNRSGALTGSYPVWGTYAPFKYPCWATKFLVDLLLLRKQDGEGNADRTISALQQARPTQAPAQFTAGSNQGRDSRADRLSGA
jgi:hypothetical protein